MALWRGLRCCRRAFAWVPVLLIALLLLWSYYAYVCELCLVTVSNPVEKGMLAYLVVFHILFVLFVWTYWKSVFTLPIQPGKKFHMSYADQERYENEERPEVQRQILAEIARKLPVYTRTGNGGQAGTEPQPPQSQPAARLAPSILGNEPHSFLCLFLLYLVMFTFALQIISIFNLFPSLVLCCFPFQGELTNARSKFHILFLLFVAVMFFVSLMFLFGYHCWLVSRNRSTLEAFSAPVFQNGPDKNGFNLGFVKNLQQVFGEEKKLWLLPIASRNCHFWSSLLLLQCPSVPFPCSQGDGHFFPMRTLSEARNPLLANEEQWEEDGIDEEPQGKELVKLLVLIYSSQ
uniref:Zinc finger DHHC-type containing 15 n=1 Tax=Junco hyemalis TaxID=40217 RepID=A0A8C5IBP3_JUNHY